MAALQHKCIRLKKNIYRPPLSLLPLGERNNRENALIRVRGMDQGLTAYYYSLFTHEPKRRN